ncbi:M10 family metallopeptidase C-terminal domain-containing protein [Jannaschia sp.]|nr:M10 family metallopeptidase C-terminal domain-containing protein [Jannaschia sp.]
MIGTIFGNGTSYSREEGQSVTVVTYAFDGPGNTVTGLGAPGPTISFRDSEIRQLNAALAEFEAVAALDLQQQQLSVANRGDVDVLIQGVREVPGLIAGYASVGAGSSLHVIELFSDGRTRKLFDELFIHEFGHNLNLTHPFDNILLPGLTNGDSASAGAYGLNRNIYTTMAYRSGDFPGTPGVADGSWAIATNLGAVDIGALQSIYGANKTFAGANDVYGILTNEIKTIWDTGGTDLIDFGAAEDDAVIDLRAATLKVEEGGGGRPSYVAKLDDDGSGRDKASAYTIAFGVEIENGTTGRGDDRLTGNDAANVLISGAGSDTLKGGEGDDLLRAGGTNLATAVLPDLNSGRRDQGLQVAALDTITTGATFDFVFRIDDLSRTQKLMVYDSPGRDGIDLEVTFNPASPTFQLSLSVFTPNEGGSTGGMRTGNGLEAGKLYRATVVRETDGETTFYLDGVKAGSLDILAGNLLESGGTLTFGQTKGDPDPNLALDGAIGEVAIHGGILSPSDIGNRDVLALATPGEGSLIHHWKPDAATGAHATLTGGSPLVASPSVTYAVAQLETDDDLIFGEGGNDTLEGGLGDDTLDGGDGIDTAIFAVSSDAASALIGRGDLTITSAEGTDLVRANVERLQFTDKVLTFDEAKALDGATAPEGGQDVGAPVTGGDDPDDLTGSDVAETVTAGGGDDVIDAGDGDDMASGGNGSDVIRGGDGDDVLAGDVAPVTSAPSADVAVLDGNSENLTSPFTGPSEGFTIEAVFRLDANTEGTLISFRPTTPISGFSVIYSPASGDSPEGLYTSLFNARQSVSSVDNPVVPFNLPQDQLFRLTLVATPDGTVQVFVDGTAVTQLTFASADRNGFNDGDITFGRDDLPRRVSELSNGPESLTGAVGELAIFSGLQTAEQIAARSVTGIAEADDPSLLAYWVPNAAQNRHDTRAGQVDLEASPNVTYEAAGPVAQPVTEDDGQPRNDTLIGGLGDDTLFGGDGEDEAVFAAALTDITIETAERSLIVTSSEGVDVVSDDIEFLRFDGVRVTYDGLAALEDAERVDGSDEGTVIQDGVGDQLILANGGDDTIFAFAGNDTIDGGEGNDRIIMPGFTTAPDGFEDPFFAEVVLGDGRGFAAIDAFEVENTLISIENAQGTLLADRLVGDRGDNALNAAAGDDLLIGGGGDDVLAGDDGNDTLMGGDGQDTARFFGLDLADVTFDLEDETLLIVSSRTGIDLVHSDVETLQFDDQTISFARAAGTEVLIETVDSGGTLVGSDADERFAGGDGDDIVRLGGGDDTVEGGDGFDTVVLSEVQQVPEGFDDVFFVESSLEDGLAEVGSLGDRIALSGVEAVEGSAFADYLVGDEFANLLRGGGGDDVVSGLGEEDTLEGGIGDDLLIGGEGSDTLRGDDGQDTLTGQGGRDLLDGGEGDDLYVVGDNRDRIVDSGGFDTVSVINEARVRLSGGIIERAEVLEDTGRGWIFGDEGATEILGNEDRNTLVSGGGADTMTGGAESDFFAFQQTEVPTTALITDFDGTDKLFLDDQFFGMGNAGINVRALSASDVRGLLRDGLADFDLSNAQLLLDVDGSGELVGTVRFQTARELDVEDVFLF